MGQRRFCIIASSVVGGIGSIILAPALGPLALALPVLSALHAKRMSRIYGLSEDSGTKKQDKTQKFLPYGSNKQDSPKFSTSSVQSSMDFNHGRFKPEIFSSFTNKDSDTREIKHTERTSQNRGNNSIQGLRGARGSLRNESYLRRHGRG